MIYKLQLIIIDLFCCRIGQSKIVWNTSQTGIHMTSYTKLPNIRSPLLRNINSQGELEIIMYVQYTTLQAIPNKYCLLEFVPEVMNSSPFFLLDFSSVVDLLPSLEWPDLPNR